LYYYPDGVHASKGQKKKNSLTLTQLKLKHLLFPSSKCNPEMTRETAKSEKPSLSNAMEQVLENCQAIHIYNATVKRPDEIHLQHI
jgi:hypothetical protein